VFHPHRAANMYIRGEIKLTC